jgi:hypothetical protein
VRVLNAQRWPTMIPEADFRRVTGDPGFPKSLEPSIKNGSLEYYCNTLVAYAVRGVHTTLNVIWDWEAPAGSDTHFAYYKGTNARIEVRQTRADKYRPELYVVPADPASKAQVLAAVQARLGALQKEYAGVGVDDRGAELHVTIPDTFRVGHEAHFAQVTTRFLHYLRERSALPAWERSNMIAKYFVTTTGTELSRKGPPRVAKRIAPM